MARIDPPPHRLKSRSGRCRDRRQGWSAWGAAALFLAGAACGQAGLEGGAEVPVAVGSRRLVAAPAVGLQSEVLRASVEVFGLQIATLDSALCAAPAGGASLQTEVEAAPLVKVIRRSSGEAKTELSPPGAAPRASEYTFRDGDIVRHYEVDYRAGGYSYVYDNGGVERRTGVNEVPEGAEPHDMHSAMLLLRAWRPRLDERAYFYVVLGRRPWRVDVTSRGPEMIKLAGEPRLTYRIDGVAVRLDQGAKATPAKRFSLWLSEERERVPLRMVADASFGQVTMTLTGREARGDCKAPALATGDAERRASARPGRIGAAWSSERRRQP